MLVRFSIVFTLGNILSLFAFAKGIVKKKLGLAYSAHLSMRLIPRKEHQGCLLALSCLVTKLNLEFS